MSNFHFVSDATEIDVLGQTHRHADRWMNGWLDRWKDQLDHRDASMHLRLKTRWTNFAQSLYEKSFVLNPITLRFRGGALIAPLSKKLFYSLKWFLTNNICFTNFLGGHICPPIWYSVHSETHDYQGYSNKSSSVESNFLATLPKTISCVIRERLRETERERENDREEKRERERERERERKRERERWHLKKNRISIDE